MDVKGRAMDFAKPDLPFDILDPPTDPPAGADRALWAVATVVRTDHAEGADGFCLARSCRQDNELYPCPSVTLVTGIYVLASGWPRRDAQSGRSTDCRCLRSRQPSLPKDLKPPTR